MQEEVVSREEMKRKINVQAMEKGTVKEKENAVDGEFKRKGRNG